MKHNMKVKQTGEGKLFELRATDVSMSAAKTRYKNFLDQSFKSLSSLQEIFPYNLIDASGTLEQVQSVISREMQYQSSLELAQITYDFLNKLPRARDMTSSARQTLVDRLDTYALEYPEKLRAVIAALEKEIFPSLKRHALTGKAIIRSLNPLWKESINVDMAVDILCDREFEAVAEDYPESVKFHISFAKGRKN